MADKNYKVLICDDEAIITLGLSKIISNFGWHPETANNGMEAVELAVKNTFDAVILDINLPDISGIEVLKEIRKAGRNVPVIMLSAYGKIDFAVQAMRLGAYDYLVKPVDEEKLRIAVVNAVRAFELEAQVASLNERLEKIESAEIIGASKVFTETIKVINKVAPFDVAVLLMGESGTGKELMAKAIHSASPRKNGPFIPIDCATLPENLLESELFGYEKGAFTGALAMKKGRFELSDGGTLFLDEVGNLPMDAQKKLLRVLQERKITRIGGDKDLELDIRLVAATNADLELEMKEGRFREDLFHRLNEFCLEIPPLRKRGNDIMLLAMYFLNKYNSEFGKNVKGFDDESQIIMFGYEWPGNIRELNNAVKSAVLMADGMITAKDLPAGVRLHGQERSEIPAESAGKTMKEALSGGEKEMIMKALEKNRWNRTKTAAELGIDFKTLKSRMEKYGIS